MAALVIPILALVVFLAVAPPSAQASAQTGSCPGNAVYSPCANGGCGSGGGSCYPNGSSGYPYVFCRLSNGGVGGAGGPGTCNNGCVTCTYGPA